MDFDGKVALITGSSRGIGRAIALKLSSLGASIVVNYKKNEGEALETVRQIRAMGSRAMSVKADIERSEDIRMLFSEVAREFGYLDIFVANAAASAFKPIMELKDYHIQRTFDISVKGLILCVQEAVKLMEGRRGKIVAISGIDSYRYLRDHSVLGAAKAAVDTFVKYMAYELAPRGINVNAISPGLVDTDSPRVSFAGRWEEFEAKLVAATPKGRIGQPEDIANVAAFLCSDEADWICGQTLIVDGGLQLTQIIT